MKKVYRPYKKLFGEKTEVKKFAKLKTALQEMLGKDYSKIGALMKEVELSLHSPEGMEHKDMVPDVGDFENRPTKRDDPSDEFERHPLKRKKASGEHDI